MKYYIKIAAGIGVLCAVPFLVHAQNTPIPGGSNALVIEVATQDIIEPQSDVSLSARSLLVDLERSAIVWTVNGTRLETYDNSKTAVVRVGALGTETRVELDAQNTRGMIAHAKIVLRPSEL